MLPIIAILTLLETPKVPQSAANDPSAHALVVVGQKRLGSGWNAADRWRHAVRDKGGKITISVPVINASMDSKEGSETKGMLVLKDPGPRAGLEIIKHPELRDRVQILVKPAVLEQLKKLGITDAAAHFKNQNVKVTGTASEVFYDCYPAIAVFSVTVHRIEDIAVVVDAPVSKVPTKL